MLVLLLACAGGDDAATTPSTGATMTCGTPGETYAPGMVRDGDAGVLRFTLVEADPAPPDVGDNTWTVAVEDAASGDPRTDVELLLSPWMPQHGHGGDPVGFALQDDGTWRSDPFDLFMSGLWEMTVSASVDGAEVDAASWTFCIEG